MGLKMTNHSNFELEIIIIIFLSFFCHFWTLTFFSIFHFHFLLFSQFWKSHENLFFQNYTCKTNSRNFGSKLRAPLGLPVSFSLFFFYFFIFFIPGSYLSKYINIHICYFIILPLYVP